MQQTQPEPFCPKDIEDDMPERGRPEERRGRSIGD